MSSILDAIRRRPVAGGTSIEGAFGVALGAGAVIGRVFLILLIAFLLVKASSALVDKIIRQRSAQDRKFIDERKAKTLRSLLKSVVRYAVYIFAGVAILDQLGIDTRSLLAGAGLVGVALGFGAQNLVRDVINGFFILFEDQFGVGDYVTIDDASGIVEAIGLRTTHIRAFGGELHIVPNGQITKVTNHMGSAMRVLFGVTVGYEADVDRAVDALSRDFEKARAEIPDIVEGPTVLGVNSLGESGVELLVVAKTKPMEQWRVERELKKRVKAVLTREGIPIPYPHLEVLVKGDAR